MDALLITAMAAITVTALALFVDVQQTRSIRKINAKIEGFESTDPGESFGRWLLAKETDKPDAPTNLEVMTTMVGRQIAGSFKNAAAGIASGESRTIRNVEKAVLEGLETPETKALLDFCDKIGVDGELGGTVYEVLNKRGLLPDILKNDGHSSGGGSGGYW